MRSYEDSLVKYFSQKELREHDRHREHYKGVI